MTTVSDLYLFRQYTRFTDILNSIDSGWPAQCRRATLDGYEVTVFGVVRPVCPPLLPKESAKAPQTAPSPRG